MATMPQQRPGKSRQNYSTPADFMAAAKGLLGIEEFAFDFAAERTNAKAKAFWTEKDNSLQQSAEEWCMACRRGWGWLNPPYDDIGTWAERCMWAKDTGASIAFLVPASVGANWYRDFVHNVAMVWALNGRLAFIPDQPNQVYPKDLILALYSPDLEPGFDVWSWKE